MLDPLDDDDLIRRAQAGDVRAFETLVRAHIPRLRRFAKSFSRDSSDADDLAQEALIKVYKSLRLYRYQAAFSTWLYAIVRNSFLDSARSRAGRERSLQEPLEPVHAEKGGEGGAPGADDLIHEKQERQRLWRAVRQLPTDFRTTLVLFDLEGKSYDEISGIEGIPVGTVKSRLNRARAQLRKLLGEPEDEAETAPTSEPLGAATKIHPEAGTSADGPSSDPPRRSG